MCFNGLLFLIQFFIISFEIYVVSYAVLISFIIPNIEMYFNISVWMSH